MTPSDASAAARTSSVAARAVVARVAGTDRPCEELQVGHGDVDAGLAAGSRALRDANEPEVAVDQHDHRQRDALANRGQELEADDVEASVAGDRDRPLAGGDAGADRRGDPEAHGLEVGRDDERARREHREVGADEVLVQARVRGYDRPLREAASERREEVGCTALAEPRVQAGRNARGEARTERVELGSGPFAPRVRVPEHACESRDDVRDVADEFVRRRIRTAECVTCRVHADEPLRRQVEGKSTAPVVRELATEREHDVGLGDDLVERLDRAARDVRGEAQRMLLRDDAAPRRRREHRRAEALSQLRDRRRRAGGAHPDEEQRSRRDEQRVRDERQRVRREARNARGRRRGRARRRPLQRGDVDLQQHRARLAGAGERQRSTGAGRDVSRRAHVDDALHERREDVDLTNRLQCGRPVRPRPRTRVDDVHERHRVEERLGDPADRIGQTRPRDRAEHRGPPRRACVSVRHERGRELVRRADDADTGLAAQRVPHLDKRRAGNAEHVLDACPPELGAENLCAAPPQ